jgi:hypothetical protein
VAEALGGDLRVTSPPDIEIARRTLTGTAFVLSVSARKPGSAPPNPTP